MPISESSIGENTKIYHKDLVNIYGAKIGDDVKIGAFVEIQKGVLIGNRVKVQSHSFICEGVTLEDEVFIGHGVRFINDRYPRSTQNGHLKQESEWKVEPTRVKKGASIGTGSVIMCGLIIGENSIVGAGSIVVKDVPPNTIYAGCPARQVRKVANGL